MHVFDVAVCSSRHAHLEPVFDALCAALPTHGYRALRLSSPQALVADESALRQAKVIAGFGDMPIDASVLARATNLRGLVSCVSGTDGIDVEAATRAGVLVAHAPTFENAHSMAEAAMLLLLHLSYDLDGTRENLRAGRGRPHISIARMVKGQTIGLVGWGRIAHNLAALLAPWGAWLLVYSRRGVPPDLPAHAQAVTLDQLMRDADKVCVLAGARANTAPIVDRAHLALMKPSAHLINLSRGSTVDEAALTEALAARRIAGAALDVFAIEPLAADSPLRTLPNVILTPHHVGHTQEADDSLIPAIIGNVLALLRGELPAMIRNPEATNAWTTRWAGRPVNAINSGGAS
jgi:phosphoglycerate dehydrogenase-like enzyme